MRRILLATAAILALTGMARADIVVDDPLHGYDVVNGVNTQVGSGTLTNLNGGDGFGFIIDPQSASGDFHVVVLVPTNLTQPLGVSINGTSAGTGIFKGIFSSGDLETFLGHPSGSPNNPIGAFTGGSNDINDPGASAFAVFDIDLGTLTLAKAVAGDAMDLFAAGLPKGTLINAYLIEADGSVVDTANSSTLSVNATVAAVPEPSTWAMMILGFFGLASLHARRQWRRENPVTA